MNGLWGPLLNTRCGRGSSGFKPSASVARKGEFSARFSGRTRPDIEQCTLVVPLRTVLNTALPDAFLGSHQATRGACGSACCRLAEHDLCSTCCRCELLTRLHTVAHHDLYPPAFLPRHLPLLHLQHDNARLLRCTTALHPSHQPRLPHLFFPDDGSMGVPGYRQFRRFATTAFRS